MERIIQPYSGHASGLPARPFDPHAFANPNPVAIVAKSSSDYLRALRRRAWLALAVALCVGVGGAAVIIRLPNMFASTARFMIEPPQSDNALTAIFPNGDVGRYDREIVEKYVPNRLTMLKSRDLAEMVVGDPTIGPGPASIGDPAADLVKNLTWRQQPQSSVYDLTLESPDPARSASMLNKMIEVFARKVNEEQSNSIEHSKRLAQESLETLTAEVGKLDTKIKFVLSGSPVFVPGGKNLLEEKYVSLNSLLASKRIRHEDLQYEARLAYLYPNLKGEAPASSGDKRAAVLLEERRLIERRLSRLRGTSRNFFGDPATRSAMESLEANRAEMAEIRSLAPASIRPDLSKITLGKSGEEIYKLELEVKTLLKELQDSMPEFQNLTTLLKDRDQKAARIADVQAGLSTFELLAKTQNKPVKVLTKATEPTSPLRPNRPLLIGVFALLGMAMGAGLVCILEHFDHSVKVPEHLTAGLALPLFGVIPRMKRLARNHRGGHLWTPGAPHSVEADAYRNLRASLLGLTGPNGALVSLLVTSAKASEGKSTTALNLAATCARAGERTILVDVDLRRPSLNDVFEREGDYHTGLVDVLKGDLPWQRAYVKTDLANLDFLPTGDATDVPVEILGTREMRQLIIALSGQYDRVILDGPAILGLADCRMLGRMVDSALLVVRSGAHELRPLQRAKAMLTQSQVPIAGIVLNNLYEDFQNWSSYGASPNPGDIPSADRMGRAAGAARGLDAPPIDASSPVGMAGSIGA